MQRGVELPKLLYKYRPVADAVRTLTERSIRASHPSLFNDPLDGQMVPLMPVIDDSFRRELIRRYLDCAYGSSQVTTPRPLIQAFIASLRMLAKSKCKDEVQKMVEKFVAEMKNPGETYEAEFAAKVLGLQQGPQIVCFSGVGNSVPMWNHYADQYRGVVLVFDCGADAESMFTVMEKVSYAESASSPFDPTEWASWMTGDAMDMVKLSRWLFFTKSAEWQYEQEYRAVVGLGPPRSCRDVSIVPNELAGVILGPKISATDKDAVISAARAMRADCMIWHARVNNRRYGFETVAEDGSGFSAI